MKNTIVVTIKGGLPAKVEVAGPDAVEIFFRDEDVRDMGERVRTEKFYVEPMSKATLRTLPK